MRRLALALTVLACGARTSLDVRTSESVEGGLDAKPDVAPSGALPRIAAGYYLACALSADGAVLCWGRNDHGQLGNGTTTDSPVPVGVAGLTSGARGIAVGYAHACAITTANAVVCWGLNARGELGDGTTTDRTTPTAVAGIAKDVTAISAGFEHTCATTQSGDVLCWGANDRGELGDGTFVDDTTPVSVVGLTGVRALASGGEFSCALDVNGAVRCWGDDYFGQLGDGSSTNSAVPVDVHLGAASRVSAGLDHACAITTTGAAACWGENEAGQLGDGTTLDSHVPVAVQGISGATGAVAIAAGTHFTCAVTVQGLVTCWGSNLAWDLGNVQVAQSTLPMTASLLTDPAANVAVGADATYAILSSGGVRSWGNDVYGQLGDGTTTSTWKPVVVAGFP